MCLAAGLRQDPLQGSISAHSDPLVTTWVTLRPVGNVEASLRLGNRQGKRAEEGEKKRGRWMSSIMSKANRRHWIKAGVS